MKFGYYIYLAILSLPISLFGCSIYLDVKSQVYFMIFKVFIVVSIFVFIVSAVFIVRKMGVKINFYEHVQITNKNIGRHNIAGS